VVQKKKKKKNNECKRLPGIRYTNFTTTNPQSIGVTKQLCAQIKWCSASKKERKTECKRIVNGET